MDPDHANLLLHMQLNTVLNICTTSVFIVFLLIYWLHTVNVAGSIPAGDTNPLRCYVRKGVCCTNLPNHTCGATCCGDLVFISLS